MSNEKTSFKEKWNKFWYKIANNPSFTLKEQLGYAAGIGGNSMAQDVEAYALTLFLTNFMGIKAIFVLLLQLVAKLVNIIADPIAGSLLDKQPRGGRSRAKAFTLITPIPLAVSSIFLFVVPNLYDYQKIIYVFVFYIIYCFADSFYDMALNTVSVRMTTNPKDRKDFYTVGQLASTLGGMLPSGLIPVLMELGFAKNNHDVQQTLYFVLALVFGLLGLALMIVPNFTLKEKDVQEWRKETPVTLNMKALALNKPMWCLCASQIVDSIRQVCYSGLAYMYIETLDAFWVASAAGVISATLSYVGIALIPVIGNKISSRNIIMGGYFYTGFMYVILTIYGVLTHGNLNIWVVMVLIGLAGFPNGGMSTARKILLADSVEYMEYMTWKKYGEPVRSEGMVFAMSSMASRICGLWKSLLLPAALAAIGYVSAINFGTSTISVIQTNEVQYNIFLIVALSGLIGNVLPGCIMLLDNYTGAKKEKLLAELSEMRAQRQAEWELAKKVGA